MMKNIKGDSGGPLAVLRDSGVRYELAGVVTNHLNK